MNYFESAGIEYKDVRNVMLLSLIKKIIRMFNKHKVYRIERMPIGSELPEAQKNKLYGDLSNGMGKD